MRELVRSAGTESETVLDIISPSTGLIETDEGGIVS